MPSMVHAPLVTSTPLFKDKPADHLAPAFTAVNGRTSPPSPQRPNGVNGMSTNSVHLRALSRRSPEHPPDLKIPLPTREWSTASSVIEVERPNGHQNNHQNGHANGHPNSNPNSPEQNGYANGHQNRDSTSPTTPEQSRSPTSPGKRKRSFSPENDRSHRQRLESSRSPDSVQIPQVPVDPSHPRTLPPMERIETDRAWAPPHELPRYHDSRLPTTLDSLELSGTTEMTRAGVQVDPKKRKRQFANRTKTGCGTCRRRKKKCDEAKPECNNCQRGGFICEGYANKVPWPKNGAQKPHLLQAKDRIPPGAQLYHSHSVPREGVSGSSPPHDGGRGRPIVVDEHDRPPARSWTNGWSEPPHSGYAQEQPPHSEYTQPPPTHGRPTSSEQHLPPSTQVPPPPRHTPRIYHHTPQTMSQVVNNGPPATPEPPLHHQQSHQPQMTPLATAPSGPPPPHYAPPPPRPQKTEKEKMLNHEPFQPFCRQLIGERDKCKNAVYSYNNSSNPDVKITADEVHRLFNAILAARWTRDFRNAEPVVSGHLGREVYIDTPFMCDYGYNISIGDNVDIGTHCKFLDSGEITIGRNTSIGANVTIDTLKTPTETKSIKGSRRLAVAAGVHIGENVHIGANCTILAGVSIGTGAIIHPGSVVVRDIPSYCVARGNPADYV